MLIDSHCHIAPPDFPSRRAELATRDATFASMFSNPRARLATADTLVEDMDRDGVERAVVMGVGWCEREVAREANDYIIQSVDRFPDRLIGFCSVNPAWAERALEEMHRCASAGLKGVGELHPDTQDFDITNAANLSPFMAAARRLKLPVLVHCSEPVGHEYPGKGRTTPDKIYPFIKNFPDNLIICAHFGGGLPFYALMPEVPEVLRNVYFDSAASPFLYRAQVYAEVSRLLGADKLLFASDYPLVRVARALGQVDEACLGIEARDSILGGNAAKLFGLSP